MVTGLVVSDAGGDIVQVEATRMEGKDELILTGQLGNVMQESARAGLSATSGPGPGSWASTRRSFEKSTHPHPRAGGRDAQGRAECRA